VAQVVARARVSRGAWSHHFSSMNALILEAAQYLMAKVYQRVGVLMREQGRNDDGLRGVIHGAWREFFDSEVNEIYLELLIASRRDRKVAAMLGGLSKTLEQNLGIATGRRFTTLPGAVSTVTEIMLLNRWMLRGIALDAPLLPEGAVAQALDAWTRVAASQVGAQPG
jgi:AcrR family transcriptional regulator